MRADSKYLLLEIEGTYGVDPTPDAADAIITNNLSRQPYGGPTISRETDRSGLGARDVINTSPMQSTSFSCDVIGSGAAGTPPNTGKLLRALGFAETIDAGVDVEYSPISNGYESVTSYYDRDVERQIVRGMRGTGSLQFNAGQWPRYECQLFGFYQRPATLVPVTPAPAFDRDPFPVNFQNTSVCTLGAYDLILNALTINFGNTVPHLNYPNLEEVRITDREMSGQITFLAPTIAEKDIYALVESHQGITNDAFALVHGPANDQFALDAPAMQLTNITEVVIEEEQGYQCDFVLKPTTVNNELLITYR